MTSEELVKLIPALLQAGSIVLTAIFAIAGLDVWRRQMVGKRKMELAESALVAFSKARDAVRRIRAPYAIQSEGKDRPPVAGETPDQKSERDTRYVTIQRIKNEQAAFDELQSLAHLARIYFGDQAVQPFTDVRTVVNTVYMAAINLYRAVGSEHLPRYSDTNINKWRDTVYEGLGEEGEGADALQQKVDRAVDAMEALCSPSLRTPAAPWPLRCLLGD